MWEDVAAATLRCLPEAPRVQEQPFVEDLRVRIWYDAKEGGKQVPHQADVALTIGLALWAGVMTLSLARLLRVPPLLFYMVVGIALGPSGLNWIRPEAFGGGLPILVEFGVALILFEGALHLSGARASGFPLQSRRLLGITMPMTAVLSALAARYWGGLDWIPAACLGAVLVVTGPTTVGPLLRNISLGRRLETLFRHEAIWGDCLGILLASAILPFWVQAGTQSMLAVPYLLLERALLAALLGLGLGFALSRLILPFLGRFGDPELPGMMALGSAALAFALGQTFSPGSGPIASAVAGFTLALHRAPFAREVRAFKGQVASLFIAMFFILLSALIDLPSILSDLPSLGLVTGVVSFLVRPVAVMAGLAGTRLLLKERVYFSLVGPRGIVALATASYALTQLPGNAQAQRVFSLTLLVILTSGAVATALGRALARLLSVSVPEPRTGIVIFGANPFTVDLADILSQRVQACVLDSDPLKIEDLRGRRFEALRGDALSEELYEDLAERGYRRILAATPNDALNRAAVEAAEYFFGRNRVFQVLNRPAPDLLAKRPGLRRQIAFSERFSLREVLGDWQSSELAIAERADPETVALASLLPDGFRILRASGAGKQPYLVIRRRSP